MQVQFKIRTQLRQGVIDLFLDGGRTYAEKSMAPSNRNLYQYNRKLAIMAVKHDLHA